MTTNTDEKASSTASLTGTLAALAEKSIRRFYQNDHLATEISEKGTRHILWSQDIALAQLEPTKASELLQVDQANSVLGIASDSVTYSPYGNFEGNSAALLAFNGQRFDFFTQGYALGNGVRIYNKNRRRFDSPDIFSPFYRGELNAYSYCQGDPINKTDPSGHFGLFKLRTWFRSNKTKMAQRRQALNDLEPELEKKTQKLKDFSRTYNKNSPIKLEKEWKLGLWRANLDSTLSRATRKLEGINKYASQDEKYTSQAIEEAKALMASTLRTKYIPEEKPRRLFFDTQTSKDDPYDDKNYQDKQSRIRNS